MPILGDFSCTGRTISRSHPPSDQAGRTFSRTRRNNIATLKPPTPLLTPNKEALKPTTPLHPKTAPKTPISHPQRRWRFQSRLGRRPQRRWRFQLGLGRRPQRRRWFQPHTDASKQRRHRFQESGPPGLQDPDAIPVAGGGAWPGDQGAADVTNVVKPPRFKSPHEDPCDKRRQSKPKNHHNQRKSPQIDDVCNNGSEIHTKNTLD